MPIRVPGSLTGSGNRKRFQLIQQGSGFVVCSGSSVFTRRVHQRKSCIERSGWRKRFIALWLVSKRRRKWDWMKNSRKKGESVDSDVWKKSCLKKLRFSQHVVLAVSIFRPRFLLRKRPHFYSMRGADVQVFCWRQRQKQLFRVGSLACVLLTAVSKITFQSMFISMRLVDSTVKNNLPEYVQ